MQIHIPVTVEIQSLHRMGIVMKIYIAVREYITRYQSVCDAECCCP
jgi:hypothetical protein